MGLELFILAHTLRDLIFWNASNLSETERVRNSVFFIYFGHVTTVPLLLCLLPDFILFTL